MTVGELKLLIADKPDGMFVEVMTGYDDHPFFGGSEYDIASEISTESRPIYADKRETKILKFVEVIRIS